MCGRYVQASSPALLAERFDADDVRVEEHEPDFNVTPRRDVPIVAATGEHRVLDSVRWGLVPSWAKDVSIGDRLINARAETVAEKPAYRTSFEKRRCLIPADGFFEWQRVAGRKQKQPYFIARADREPMAFAGLYAVWKDRDDPDAEWLRSCVIVTTDANDALAPIHDRMPVILDEGSWDEWLDPANHDTEALRRLLVPAPSGDFVFHPVSTRVNRPTNNDRSLLDEVALDAGDESPSDGEGDSG